MAWSFIKVVVIVLLNRFFDSSPPSSFPLPLFVKGILLLHSLTVVYYYAYVVLSSSAVAAQQAQHIPLFRLYSFQSFFAPVSFYSFSFLLFLFFFTFSWHTELTFFFFPKRFFLAVASKGISRTRVFFSQFSSARFLFQFLWICFLSDYERNKSSRNSHLLKQRRRISALLSQTMGDIQPQCNDVIICAVRRGFICVSLILLCTSFYFWQRRWWRRRRRDGGELCGFTHADS